MIVERIFVPINRFIIVLPVIERISVIKAAMPRQIRTVIYKMLYACSIIYFSILSVSIINQDGEVLLNTLCNTERKKSWYGAQRIHGISPRDVLGKPTFAQILPQVLEILSSVDFVIAYNIIFEYNFVKSYIKCTNPIYSVNYQINWAMHKDPMHMYAEYIGSRKWIKLSEAAKSFGYNFNPHDSLEDVKATLFLYNQLK